MSFLLDTNLLSGHLRGQSRLSHRFIQYSGRLYASSVSLAELYEWVFARPDATERYAAVERLIYYEVSVIPFDAECAVEFGRLRAELRPQGINVDEMDLLIAATATFHGLTLVTYNTKHFRQIPGLQLEDWLAP